MKIRFISKEKFIAYYNIKMTFFEYLLKNDIDYIIIILVNFDYSLIKENFINNYMII